MAKAIKVSNVRINRNTVGDVTFRPIKKDKLILAKTKGKPQFMVIQSYDSYKGIRAGGPQFLAVRFQRFNAVIGGTRRFSNPARAFADGVKKFWA